MMRHVLVVYNRYSSRYVYIESEVLSRLDHAKGCRIDRFSIEKAPFESNVKRLGRALEDGDLVIAIGGDATAAVVANAVMESERDVTLAVLPYGNFNDLARTLKTRTLEDVLRITSTKKLYPLDIVVDGEHWRFATCYVTMGMTAESVKIFDEPRVRHRMQKKGYKNPWRSYFRLADWYFKNRNKKKFIPSFKINGRLQSDLVSDYVAVNGRSMCRVMRGREDYLKPFVFRSKVFYSTNFWHLLMMMVRSMLYRVPGRETRGDELEFIEPSVVLLQAEGEFQQFENVRRIEIKKSVRHIKVIQK